MTRIVQPAASKGSMRWLQQMVQHHPAVLQDAIGIGPITWKSPLAADQYAEYRDQEALTLIGISTDRRALSDFWPAQGPQWDGLGLAESGEAVLIEAKAHVPELFSGASQASGDSLDLIKRSLAETAQALSARPGLDWTKRFYQYANRLAMGYFLNSVNLIPARIAFLYFVGDAEMSGPASRSEWQAALEVLHEALGIRGAVPPYVSEAFIDIRGAVPVVA